MKRVLLLNTILLFAASSYAAIGIWSSAVLLRVNNTVQYYNTNAPGGANNFGPSGFQGTDFGAFVANADQLEIGGGGLKTFKNGGGNVCGGTIYYVVYPTGSRPASPVFNSITIGYNCDCNGSNQFPCTANSPCGGGDQVWETASPTYTDVTAGLVVGNYTIEVYYSITGDATTGACNPNAAFDNNGGNPSNYTATFTITSVLPLQVTSFTAKEQSQSVKLDWKLNDNQEAERFEIERSVESRRFEKIGELNALPQTGLASYSYIDASPSAGMMTQYRVKLIFRNGSIKYTDLRLIRFQAKGMAVALQMNPVRSILKLLVQNEKTSLMQVSIINDKGQLLIKKQYQMQAGSNSIDLAVEKLPVGLYRVMIEDEFNVKTVSFLKN